MPIHKLSSHESTAADPVIHLGKAIQAIVLQVQKTPVGSAEEKVGLVRLRTGFDLLHDMDNDASVTLGRMLAAQTTNRACVRETVCERLSAYAEDNRARELVAMEALAPATVSVGADGRLPEFTYVRRSAAAPART